ncbi:MAG: hypothetical protein VX871_00770 [Pseudomonadota bacterium]|nr:hypothetical protein [Pseudomonadota bacterium]
MNMQERDRQMAANSGEAQLPLPDPLRTGGRFRPFANDPGRDEAWWWLGIPAALAIFLLAVNAISPAFYEAWILPEGYGFLELGHFLIPIPGLVIALALLARPWVRRRRLVTLVVVIGALACFYIAGEEQSWGQHFFNWQTPGYWAEINRQQETNLHNTMDLFDKKPRALLEIGVLVGGLIIPVAALFLPWIRRNRWSLFLPAAAIMPVSAGALFFKLMATVQKEAGVDALVLRPAEATESYLYLFILFYLVMFARRVRELEAAEKS